MTVRICTSREDISQLYDILQQRKKVAGRPINTSRTKDEFIDWILPHAITYGYFNGEELISFLVSKGLKEIPAWHIFLIGTKYQQEKFDIKESKFPEITDATLEYWESQNIFSFTCIQPRYHRGYISGMSVATVSEKMKEYTLPAATLEIIKKGEKSKFDLINTLNQQLTFNHDMVVKWCFKKDCFNSE